MRNGTENQIVLYLIRHGSTEANREGRYLGQTDLPLSEFGREEICRCAAQMTEQQQSELSGIRTVFASPLKRCMESAQILFPDRDVIEIPKLREIDFGAFEMKTYRELDRDPDYQRWIDSGGTLAFPGGESREDFIGRSMAGFAQIMEYLTENGAVCAAAVVHGGSIMAVLSELTHGEYFDYQVKPGRGCRVCLSKEQDAAGRKSYKITEIEEIR